MSAVSTEFYKDTDWQTGGPMQTVMAEIGALWPQGSAQSKDDLVDGLHPVVALVPKANRSASALTGIVVSVEDAAGLVQVNIAKGAIVKQFVANVLTYAAGSPATFDQSVALGQPVYLDDSTDLAAGVTLSLSPKNESDADNPLVGWIWYDQSEYKDAGVGGANAASAFPKVVANSLTNTIFNILLK